MKNFIRILFFLIAASLISCQSGFNRNTASGDFGTEEETAYRTYLSKLASDEFMGRKPFTRGEQLTVEYLKNSFQDLGLEPANNGSYFQDVPMVEIKGSFEEQKMTVKGKRGNLDLHSLTDIVGGTRRVVAKQEIKDAPIIFAGFGIDAPEYNWNDFDGIDTRGKILIVMVNDPGFYDPGLFRGRDMTYYGRWTYKFEEAAKKGAEGVLIIHDTQPASYGWGVVRSSWSKSKLFLQTENNNMDFCAIEGWISGDAAKKLFDLAGVNFDDLIDKAKQPGFRAVPLDLTLSGTINNEIRKATSKNVVAVLPGTTQKDEYIIYSAHWDHFGIGEPIDGDSIYNGAADNATGTAALLTLAKKFKENPPLKRSVLFFSPTGEEAGLLGSEYYATHPIYPLKKTIIDINFDVFQPFGKMKDIFIVGDGQSDVDQLLEDAAKKENRVVRKRSDPSDGWYYRSDHFNFAKVGVPTLYTEGGSQSIEHGEEWAEQQKAEFTRSRYHKPQDNYNPNWDVSGTMDDLKLMYEVGRKLANSGEFPTWNDGTMYKRIRDAQQ